MAGPRPAPSCGSAGVSLDSSGNLYIADTYNNRVRKVVGGAISTVAGNGTRGYAGDGGPATSANLAGPWAVAVDSSGNVFISDTGNQVIREVAAANGVISTYAGSGIRGTCGDGGPATSAQLNVPEGIALDNSGDVDVAEFGYSRAREVMPQGAQSITSLTGNAQPSIGGTYVSFSATVTALPPAPPAPAGNVTFMDGCTIMGSGALAAGTASFSYAGLIVGAHTITAVYDGSMAYQPSVSSPVVQIVTSGGTNTGLTTSPNPSTFGASVTMTATVTPITPGSVTPVGHADFFNGQTFLGRVDLDGNGMAVLNYANLPSGTNVITAQYSGSDYMSASTSQPVNQVVN